MWSICKIFLAVILLHIAKASEVKIFRKTHSLDVPQEGFDLGDFLSKQSNNIAYAKCSKIDSSKLTCRVTVETWVDDDIVLRNVCPRIQMSTRVKSRTIYEKPILKPLNLDTVLLIGLDYKTKMDYERPRELFHLVNMQNCTSVYLQAAHRGTSIKDRRGTAQLFYDNKLEILMNDTTTCGNLDGCAIGYDMTGKKVIEHWPFPFQEYYDYVASQDVSVKDQIYYGVGVNSDSEFVVTSFNGESTELMREKIEPDPEERRLYFTTPDVTNNIFGVSWLSSLSAAPDKPIQLSYALFQDMKMIDNGTIELYDHKIDWLAIRYFENIGLVSVRGDCSKISNFEENQGYLSCNTARILVLNKNYRPVEIESFFKDNVEADIVHGDSFKVQILDSSAGCFQIATIRNFIDVNYRKICIPTKYLTTPYMSSN